MENMQELAAKIAEIVRDSLRPDLKEIKDELNEIKTKLANLEKEVKKLSETQEQNEITTAFLAKDVYLLKKKVD